MNKLLVYGTMSRIVYYLYGQQTVAAIEILKG